MNVCVTRRKKKSVKYRIKVKKLKDPEKLKYLGIPTGKLEIKYTTRPMTHAERKRCPPVAEGIRRTITQITSTKTIQPKKGINHG